MVFGCRFAVGSSPSSTGQSEPLTSSNIDRSPIDNHEPHTFGIRPHRLALVSAVLERVRMSDECAIVERFRPLLRRTLHRLPGWLAMRSQFR